MFQNLGEPQDEIPAALGFGAVDAKSRARGVVVRNPRFLGIPDAANTRHRGFASNAGAARTSETDRQQPTLPKWRATK